MRMQMRRFTRLTNAFSKKLDSSLTGITSTALRLLHCLISASTAIIRTLEG